MTDMPYQIIIGSSEIEYIRKWAAEKVMGWSCMDEPKNFEEFGTIWHHNFQEKNPGFIHADGTFVSEKDWNDAQYYLKDGERVILKRKWHPDTDLNQTFMVVNRMRELEIWLRELSFNPYTQKWLCRFIGKDTHEFKYADTPALAILLAARKAVEGAT